MKLVNLIIIYFLICIAVYPQEKRLNFFSFDNTSDILKPEKKESINKWAINVVFSDNGFGAGASLYYPLSENVMGFSGLFFSGAKDDREFDSSDLFGNTYTPFKINRLFMIPLNLGVQFRLFRNEVTDNLRPLINFGITPTVIIYTPYDKSFFYSFKFAHAKYTVGAFAGAGVDYLTSKTSSINVNVRYYYLSLFGEGIQSIESKEKKFYGGIYFVFSYNFMR